MSVDFAVYRETLSKSFKIAAIGAGLCTLAAAYDLVAYLADIEEEMGFIMNWLNVIGLFIFGGGMVSAGQKLCELGHKETGVTSAGGGLIFAGIIEAIIELFVSEDSLMFGTSSYVWMGLSILGLVIAYYSLKQGEDKDDKFFSTAACGFGIIIVSQIILFAALKLIISYGDEVFFRNPNLFIKIAIWISEHYRTVMIVYFSIIILGNLLCWLSVGSYTDFLKDVVQEKRDEKREELKEKLINEALSEYKRRKAEEVQASDDDAEHES